LYAFDFAREQKINTIAVTHSAVSELAERATVTLVANRGPVSQTNSLAMPMTILNALVISLAEKEGSKGLNALKKLDQFKNHLSKTNLDYNKKG
jgi:DNA-binding MurR/RpiR family transcriptional regulator